MPSTSRTRRAHRAGVGTAALLVLVLATACTSGATATPRTREYPAGDTYEARTEREVIDLVNTERGLYGLPAMSWDGQLGWLSMDWSQSMASQNSLVHRDLNHAIRNLVSGFRRLGENILVGGCGMSALEMHLAWMTSPSHRANMLDPGYTSIAVGVVCDPGGRVWATTNFGTT